MHHSSIEKIKEDYNGMSGFNFKCVTSDYIVCILNKLNARKATGFDNIPPNITTAWVRCHMYPTYSPY